VATTTWIGGQLAERARPHLTEIDDLARPTAPGGIRIDAPTGSDRRRVEGALHEIVPGLADADPAFPSRNVTIDKIRAQLT
jgi:hypothetical protein